MSYWVSAIAFLVGGFPAGIMIRKLLQRPRERARVEQRAGTTS